VRRVPFGEYVPARWLVGRLADLSRVPRDAQPGRGPGLLVTPAGRLGTLISYEVFFADRARAAVQAGASVLLVPTNAASYTSGQVPAMQVAAARLRALETGRAVVQAAPTGYSALVDPAGRVMARGGLGGPAVLQGGVELRSGRTLYARTGDGPLLAGAVVALGSAWVGAHRRGRTSRRLRRRNPQETTVCRSRLDIDLRRPDGRGLAEDTYGGYITSGWSCPPELSAVTTKGALAW
jgi:apolipoprotein N-acyltransferase